ncbi:hypothetical protein RU97_GL000648 [Enterococcus canis]|uniref:MucBP domain-containing protein n=1 Tax=Enterococcus canis TaxID=214095 RepID=A0A1L8RBX4_9ENTE|nr:hypothetical protein RU97_GL000648 [Enterococcus canis]
MEVPSNAKGTVGYDPIEVNYVYREVEPSSTITVTPVDENGDPIEGYPSEEYPGKPGDPVDIEVPEIPGYERETPDEDIPTEYPDEDTDVPVTYVKVTEIKVTYQDEDGNELQAGSEKTQRVETDYETTGPETIEKDGKTYELVEVPSNAQGTVGYDPIEVNYVYREVKKDPEDPENSKDPKDPEKEKDTEEPTKSDSNKNGESNIPSLVTDKNNGDQAKKLTASLAGNQVVSKGTNNSLRVYPKMNESGSKILMIIGTGLSSIAVGMWLYRKKR